MELQIEENIRETFSKKGYYQTSQITKRQFHILMNTLMTDQHELFHQEITNQIWKQAQAQKNNNLAENPKPKKNNKTVSMELIILTMMDAIQILTNNILECEEKIQQHRVSIVKLEKSMQYAKVEQIESKIKILEKDKIQFDKDFNMLTGPFLNVRQTNEFRRKMSIRKNSSLEMALRKNTMNQNDQNQLQKFQIKLKEMDTQDASQSQLCEGKRCSKYFLTFIFILELSTCLYKPNFVNLTMIVLGYLVLLEDSFKRNMVKITLIGSFFTIFLDVLWLALYSETYLNSRLNSGLKHQLKPFSQFVWLITVLQVFIKIIYCFYLRQYQKSALMLSKKLQSPQGYQNFENQFTDAVNDRIRQMSNQNNSQSEHLKHKKTNQALQNQDMDDGATQK